MSLSKRFMISDLILHKRPDYTFSLFGWKGNYIGWRKYASFSCYKIFIMIQERNKFHWKKCETWCWKALKIRNQKCRLKPTAISSQLHKMRLRNKPSGASFPATSILLVWKHVMDYLFAAKYPTKLNTQLVNLGWEKPNLMVSWVQFTAKTQICQ